MTILNLETTQHQARKLLDSRIPAVTELVKTRQRITQLQAELKEAEREDQRAYLRALKDGWSGDELKKLGLENAAATRRRARRPGNGTAETENGSAATGTE